MKQIITTIAFLFIPMFAFADNPSLEDQLMGGWQTVKYSPHDQAGPDPIIWKKYRNDGNVEVIWGYPGGFRLETTYSYKIDNNKLIDTDPISNRPVTYDISLIKGRLKLSSSESSIWEIYERKEKPTKKLIMLPKMPTNLDESLAALKKILPRSEINKLKKSKQNQLRDYNRGLGAWLRTNWRLWYGSELKDFFIKIGIRHPEDMSAVILKSFWNHLNGKPINLDEQVSYYQEFYNYAWLPENAVSPIDGSEIKFTMSSPCKEKTISIHCRVHFGASAADGTPWAYQYGKGLFEPTEEDKKKISEHIKLQNKVIETVAE